MIPPEKTNRILKILLIVFIIALLLILLAPRIKNHFTEQMNAFTSKSVFYTQQDIEDHKTKYFYCIRMSDGKWVYNTKESLSSTGYNAAMNQIPPELTTIKTELVLRPDLSRLIWRTYAQHVASEIEVMYKFNQDSQNSKFWGGLKDLLNRQIRHETLQMMD